MSVVSEREIHNSDVDVITARLHILFEQSAYILYYLLHLGTTESWRWIRIQAENFRQRENRSNRMDGS
jgi:hypothetical protein